MGAFTKALLVSVGLLVLAAQLPSASGVIVYCSVDNDCYPNQFCDATTMMCQPGLYSTFQCTRDRQCRGTLSSRCLNSTCKSVTVSCTKNSDCLDFEYCNSKQQCVQQLVSGMACNTTAQCYSKNCTSQGTCAYPPTKTKCTAQTENSTCGQYNFCLYNTCLAKRPSGSSCTAHNQCLGGACINAICGSFQTLVPPPSGRGTPPPSGITRRSTPPPAAARRSAPPPAARKSPPPSTRRASSGRRLIN